MESGKLTLEKIEGTLEEIFKENQIPRFSPSVEKEVDEYLKEHLDEFYFADYSTMESFINVDSLKKVLNEFDNKEIKNQN